MNISTKPALDGDDDAKL